MKTAGICLLFSFLGITFNVKADVPALIVAASVLILIDFITGIIKAKTKNQARTSIGYRKSLIKFMQYGGAVSVSMILQLLIKRLVTNAADVQLEKLQYVSFFVICFVIYIEITSIFENLYDIDNKSMFSKFFYQPMLWLLKFGLKNNPVAQAEERLKKEEPDKTENNNTP